MQKIKIGTHIWIFLFLIIIGCVYYFLSKSKLVNIFVVKTSSMEPSISTDSLILVYKSSFYKVNDVISYKTDANAISVTHRITSIYSLDGKYFFILKGDGNVKEDPYPISQDEIIGKVVIVIPYLGALPKVFVSYKLLWISIYFPLGLVMGRKIGELMFDA